MSFNILREDGGDSNNKWGKRKAAVLNMLYVNDPAVIGLQECSWTIREDILAADSNRSAVGVSVSGQESGYTKESSNTIIYRNDILEVLDDGTFWLSDTPDKVSVTWANDGVEKYRTCTWAKFRMKNSSEKSFYVFNLHLEADANATDRIKALRVVHKQINDKNPDNIPVIITGDHNDKETDLTLGYLGSGFTSARDVSSPTDTGATLNGFGESITTDVVIDHIYTKKCTPSAFYVDRNRYNGRDYISDHYPVYCDLTIN